jgi:hypothetical protein
MSEETVLAQMITARRIGHATFETPDLDSTIEHYAEAIGLLLASRDGDRAYFASRLGQMSMELQRGPKRRCLRLSFEVAADSDFAAMTVAG